MIQKHISLRAAALIIKDNKILAAKNVNNPCYYIVGGGIEPNESSKDAVVREVFEETGIRMEIDRLAIIQERFYMADNQKYHEIVFFYSMKPTNDVDILSNNTFTDQVGVETLHWLPISDLKNCNIVPEFLKIINLNDLHEIKHIISDEYI